MSEGKAGRVARYRAEGGPGMDPHYAGWFACFNRGEYFEAHDVLEVLWLRERRGPDDLFYKGLIQLAGAFVHLQKGRLRPADALFRLAEGNLARYRPRYRSLDLESVLALITDWRQALEASNYAENPLGSRPAPAIQPDGTAEQAARASAQDPEGIPEI
jgi:hypothetical protein